MTDWQAYLLEKLGSLLIDAPGAIHWLNGLNANTETQILGLSLATDLACSSLTPVLLADALRLVDSSSEDLCQAFVEAVRNHGNCRFLSRHKFQNTDESPALQYARTLGLREFYKYSYKDAYSLTMSEEDFLSFREALIETAGLSIGEIRKFSGNNGINWVADLAEIETQTGNLGQFRDQAASVLVDSLGLPEKKPILLGAPPELLIVSYPIRFADEVWKPTTLDGFWIGGFYISWHRKQWGKTQPCSGQTDEAIRERIHRPVAALTHEFRAWYVGPVEKKKQDRDALLKEATRRWTRRWKRLFK